MIYKIRNATRNGNYDMTNHVYLYNKKYIFIIVILFIVLFSNLPKASFASSDSIRLVIFPFQNLSQNKADDWIGNGFAETLTASLATLQNLVILERSQLKNILSEQTLSQTAYVDQKTAIEMGKILSANVVVLGSFQKNNNQIRIISRFVDVQTGQVQKDHIVDILGKMDDIFALQNKLADKIIQSFNVKVSPDESQKITKNIHSTNSINAYENFIKGKKSMNEMALNGAEHSIEYFKKAIIDDPEYAIAYAYVSISYSRIFIRDRDMYNKKTDEYKLQALEYANKALSLNPDLPESHRALAEIYNIENNFTKASEELKIALKLNPNDVETIVMYISQGFMDGKIDLAKNLAELEKFVAIDKDTPML